MSELITPEILDTGIKVLGLSVVAKSLDGPIQTINDIWGLLGGDWLHAKRLKYQQKYAEKIVEKVVNIPPEKLQEPKLSILGPALEASKFYIEEEEIREMFANLIAASMNSDYNNYIQHSFVEIIKQLTPHDAKLFKSFISSTYPCCNIRLIEKEKTSGYYLFRNFFIADSFPNHEENAISLVNLQKQGLILFEEDYILSEENLYKPFTDSDYFKEQTHLYEITPGYENYELTIKKGAFHITKLGEVFRDICIGKSK